jgi:hypothetical protein
MPGRRAFASLNHLFDVKYISLDLKKGGIRRRYAIVSWLRFVLSAQKKLLIR